MTPSTPHRLARLATIGFVWAAFCSATATLHAQSSTTESTADATIPMELRPYDVAMRIAFADDPVFTSPFRTATIARLADRCDRFWGSMCRVRVTEDRQLFPVTAGQLSHLTPTAIPRTNPPGDKLYLFTVEAFGPRIAISARVWDDASQDLSEVAAAGVHLRTQLPQTLFALARELFEPVAKIEDFDHKTVSLRVRAGELAPSDPEQKQLPPNRLLLPFNRFLSRELELQRVQQVPWTYLVVTDSQHGRVNCRLVSGLRKPLTKRRRKRIESIAVAARPRSPSTQLQLVSQNTSLPPLAGYTVTAIPEDGEPTRHITGRDGRISLPSTGATEPVWLYVRSGKSLLARLPFVPGLTAHAVVPLPDDSLRLAVEGQLAVLEASLIDTVATRSVIASRARLLARIANWDEFQKQIALLDDLPRPSLFHAQLVAIREPAIETAAGRADRSAAANIRRICKQTAELIDTYLDPDKIKNIKEELQELRQALTEEDQPPSTQKPK